MFYVYASFNLTPKIRTIKGKGDPKKIHMINDKFNYMIKILSYYSVNIRPSLAEQY